MKTAADGGMGSEGPSRRRRVRGRLGAAVATLVLLLIVGSWIKLGTTTPIVTVETGSMIPTLHIGDIALMESLHGKAPKVGEIVVAPVPIDVQQRLGYPASVTHRVVKIANGQLTTKGDANKTEDPFSVPLSSVHLRLVRVIPEAGRFERFMFSPFGILWLVFGGVVFLGPKILDLVRDGMVPVEVGTGDSATLGELVLAVREYGEHLRSHTAVIQGMAEASQHLAAVTSRLEAGTLASQFSAWPAPPVRPPLPPPAAALGAPPDTAPFNGAALMLRFGAPVGVDPGAPAAAPPSSSLVGVDAPRRRSAVSATVVRGPHVERSYPTVADEPPTLAAEPMLRAEPTVAIEPPAPLVGVEPMFRAEPTVAVEPRAPLVGVEPMLRAEPTFVPEPPPAAARPPVAATPLTAREQANAGTRRSPVGPLSTLPSAPTLTVPRQRTLSVPPWHGSTTRSEPQRQGGPPPWASTAARSAPAPWERRSPRSWVWDGSDADSPTVEGPGQ
jgi:signal peptidase I